MSEKPLLQMPSCLSQGIKWLVLKGKCHQQNDNISRRIPFKMCFQKQKSVWGAGRGAVSPNLETFSLQKEVQTKNQRVGLIQCPQWEQLLSQWRGFLPKCKNNGEIQAKIKWTVLETPRRPVASPGFQASISTDRSNKTLRAIADCSLPQQPQQPVAYAQFLLYCSLCSTSTTDWAKEMIFLKRIIYGGFAIFHAIPIQEVIRETSS